MDTGGTTLTLEPNITVRGHSGQIDPLPASAARANVTVINQGSIAADVSGGTVNIRAQSFTNQGSVAALQGAINLYGASSLAAGTLSLGITGLADYGRINFLNPVTMQGTLKAQFTGFYRPTTGSAFTLLTYPSRTGTFDALDLPADVLWQTTNATAFAMTATALLELPSIAVGPQTQSVVVGSNATLSVAALGAPPLASPMAAEWVDLSDGTHLGGSQATRLPSPTCSSAMRAVIAWSSPTTTAAARFHRYAHAGLHHCGQQQPAAAGAVGGPVYSLPTHAWGDGYAQLWVFVRPIGRRAQMC